MQATPFTRRNWTAEEQKQDSSGSGDNLKWEKNGTTLLIPKSYVFHKQVKANVFDCFETETEVDGKTQFRSQCVVRSISLLSIKNTGHVSLLSSYAFPHRFRTLTCLGMIFLLYPTEIFSIRNSNSFSPSLRDR